MRFSKSDRLLTGAVAPGGGARPQSEGLDARDAIAQFLYPQPDWRLTLFSLSGHPHLQHVRVTAPDVTQYATALGLVAQDPEVAAVVGQVRALILDVELARPHALFAEAEVAADHVLQKDLAALGRRGARERVGFEAAQHHWTSRGNLNAAAEMAKMLDLHQGRIAVLDAEIHEVTPDEKVVWEFADHARFKTVCQVQIIDTPADPLKGEVLR